MSPTRNPQRTRVRILAAAREEFALRGYWGSRVDVIAREAGVNKRMLYHYFGNKEGLFAATLAHYPHQHGIGAVRNPEGAHSQKVWDESRKNFLLQLWGMLFREEQRRAPRVGSPAESTLGDLGQGLLQGSLTKLKQAQQQHRLPVELSAVFLELALLGVDLLPLLLPELSQRLVGDHPSEVSFERRRRSFRRTLMRLLQARARETPLDQSGKARIRLGVAEAERR